MKHSIKVFAGIREAVGVESLTTEIVSGMTACRLKQQLASEYPVAAALIQVSRLAIDQSFVSDETHLLLNPKSVEEIALIPPVSGG
jgi:molybdopterin converting factor small subunit